MGPFVLAETKFPSFGVNGVSSALSLGSSNSNNKNYNKNYKAGNISNEKETSLSSPKSTTTTTTGATSSSSNNSNSTSSSASPRERFEDSEEYYVEIVHSSPGRRSYHHKNYQPQNNARTTTITTTRNRKVGEVHHNSASSNSTSNANEAKNDFDDMSLQLDRYGFITNIDSKGHVLETNGAENINVPTFAETERTQRREKKWKATLQSWDKQSSRMSLNSSFRKKDEGKSLRNSYKPASSPNSSNDDYNKELPLQRQYVQRQAMNKVVLRRLRKGIPDSIRGRTWVALGGGIQTPGLYQHIVKLTSEAMLENCRELQAQGLYQQRLQQQQKQQQEQQPLNDDCDDGYGDSASNNNKIGSDHSPERVGIETNSNRTSPTSAASEFTASTATTTSPTKVGGGRPSTATKTVTTGGPAELANRSTDDGPSSPSTSDNGKEEQQQNYASTRKFRSIQDIIERDIHRTYPRHNLFYEEERLIQPSEGVGETDAGNSGNINSSYDKTALPSSSNNSHSNGLLGDPELAALILNLEMDLRMATTSADKNDAAMVGLQQYSVHDGNNNCTIQATTQSGQAALRRVLRAYSYCDQEVGYCQGMNFIAGMFLTIMTEEEAFWLLVSVMSDKPCNMRGLFGEGMLETHKVLYVAEKLIHHYLSKLARHFEKENVLVTMYATQWLLTQYTSSFKFDLVFRVWDAFLGEGWKVIYRVMLALLQKYQSQLLKMSFEEILTFFRDLPDRVEGGQIMDMALKIPLRKKVIAKYEREWETNQKQK
eukprot:CAMPEP_0201179916 /NCGR_PEP_ID=MMETSP0851-20130426/114539_1 /ASSEMBLY_ACC=CAM_ASM_000631 /TAXON_ID=183588 /ORGANISM="Pseudo-nitzschia fraudulenta, Strain WWA7" /LENGTH=768 /DNA_ID=CAMNT_0047463989 /DNA_START=82 /DNA_END=2388 /DNA_ORIENTATION=+